MTDMIAATANRLFAAHAYGAFADMPHSAEAGAIPWQPKLWEALQGAGFPLALLNEEDGGFGLEATEALGLVRIAASHAAPVPLGETMLANWLLASGELKVAEGAATVASGLSLQAEGSGWHLTGHAARVPWARDAAVVAVLATDTDGTLRLARVPSGWTVTPGHNLAAEPRDNLHFDARLPATAVIAAPVSAPTLRALGAMFRAQGLAGALEAALARSVGYATERVQFGKPIGKFQAIQQSLAVMAGEVAAARVGADMAAAALPLARSDAETFTLVAAAAKLRAGEAAGIAAGIAHQVHGAIGFTRECPLHPLTRRLWAWREEFGAESEWADLLGARIARLGPDSFWPFLTQAQGTR